MAHSRPAKGQRVGGAHRDPIPYADNFSAVHAREARVVHVGNQSLSVPTERLILQEPDEAWNSAVSWLPVDDHQYALDPDGEWYDEALEGGVMEGFGDHADGAAAKGKKRVRSGVSVMSSPSFYGSRADFFIAPASCFLEECSPPDLLGGGDPLGWAGRLLRGQGLFGLHLATQRR